MPLRFITLLHPAHTPPPHAPAAPCPALQRKQLGGLLEDLLDALLAAGLIQGKAQLIEARVPIIKCCLAVGACQLGLLSLLRFSCLSVLAAAAAFAAPFCAVAAEPCQAPPCLHKKWQPPSAIANGVYCSPLNSPTLSLPLLLQGRGLWRTSAWAPATAPPRWTLCGSRWGNTQH